MTEGLVVLGASYAGTQIAISAREAGYCEPITLISDEAYLPYHRPPLSKAFLAGRMTLPELHLRSEAFYREQSIDVVLSTQASVVDRAKRSVAISKSRVSYETLAIATGTRPRQLQVPGAKLDGVIYLRSLEDALRARERLEKSSRVVVIGGGFIGLEVAAALAPLGKRITIVEAQERLLARVTTPLMSRFLADYHRNHGVEVVLREDVREIVGHRGRVRSVVCQGGRTYPADLVIAAIGVASNCELAGACGLLCRNGIVVDQYARTADKDIFAAGDCTAHPSRYAGGLLRLESVQNAIDQGKTAGSNIAGIVKVHDPVPWFWSDQYDLKLQMAGLSYGHDQCVVRGSINDARFSLFYFRAGKLIAVDSVNRPADHMVARKLLSAGVKVTPSLAQDESADLRSILAQKPTAVACGS